MARAETVMSIFLASPSDVGEERATVNDLVNELNGTWSKGLGVRLEVISWEDSVHPGVGDYAQEVINRQIGDDYDIIVAIFWGRIGTPTPNYDSGTVEELTRAMNRLQQKGTPEVLVYFKDAPLKPSRSDFDQLTKLNTLKKTLQENGCLYYMFDDTDGFESMLRNHLSLIAQRNGTSSLIKKYPIEINAGTRLTETPSANIEPETEDEDELGLLDYADIHEAKFESINNAMSAITEAVFILSGKMEKRTTQIKALTGAGETLDRGRTRKLLALASDDMDAFSHVLRVQSKIMTDARIAAFDALSHAVALHVEINNENTDRDLSVIDHQFETLEDAISGALLSTQEYQEVLAGMPRLSIDVNRSKKKAISSLQIVIDEMGAVIISTNDIRRVISEIR
jgi:hypothetical protein